MGPYIAAKHAVIGMTKSAGFDHATDGVRINAVAPGLTETDMTKAWKMTMKMATNDFRCGNG